MSFAGKRTGIETKTRKGGIKIPAKLYVYVYVCVREKERDRDEVGKREQESTIIGRRGSIRSGVLFFFFLHPPKTQKMRFHRV